MEHNRTNLNRRKSYYMVEGTIVEIEPTRMGRNRANGCIMFISVEDMEGNIVNFIVTPSTFVVDFTQLREGMRCLFYYRADAPAPMIYPPQFNASVVAPLINGQFVSVGYFNNSLVNEEQSLQIHLDSSTSVLTTNNQIYMGSPAGHNLVVLYENSTRSIPAQTTPKKIIVLCE